MARRVVVDDRFRDYNADVARAIERALLEAAEATAAAARGASSPSGYNIGDIQAKTYPELAVQHGRRGPTVTVSNRDFRGLWFEKGTYKLRKGKVSEKTIRRRQTASGQARLERAGDNAGVTAQHFLRRGLAYGQKVLMERIKADMPG